MVADSFHALKLLRIDTDKISRDAIDAIKLDLAEQLEHSGVNLAEPKLEEFNPEHVPEMEDAYYEVLDRFEEAQTRYESYQAVIHCLAVSRHFRDLGATRQLSSSDQAYLDRVTRLDSATRIWDYGCWEEPWISLFESSLPGPGPDGRDWQSIKSKTRSAERVRERQRKSEARERFTTIATASLMQAQFRIHLRDRHVIQQLAFMSGFLDLEDAWGIIQHSSKPRDPVWKTVLNSVHRWHH